MVEALVSSVVATAMLTSTTHPLCFSVAELKKKIKTTFDHGPKHQWTHPKAG